MKYSSNNFCTWSRVYCSISFPVLFFLRVSINKCQGVAESTKILGGGIENTHRLVLLWMWHLLDVILMSFIEHCQICKLHRDGYNVYIMPFLCVTIDVKPYIVFENVKLRTLLTFYGLAHYITARSIWFSAQCKSSLKCICLFFSNSILFKAHFKCSFLI